MLHEVNITHSSRLCASSLPRPTLIISFVFQFNLSLCVIVCVIPRVISISTFSSFLGGGGSEGFTFPGCGLVPSRLSFFLFPFSLRPYCVPQVVIFSPHRSVFSPFRRRRERLIVRIGGAFFHLKKLCAWMDGWLALR